jgi:PAS domain S-box-containing protein
MPRALLPWNEAERLAALRSYQILDTANEASFDNLVRLAARLTGCPVALVSLVDEDRQWFKATHGFTATAMPRDLAFCSHAILDPFRALVVPDATADGRFADNPYVTGPPGFRFYAGMPLVNPQGYALGTLCLIDYVPKQIDGDDLETLVHFARVVMSTIESRNANAPVQTAQHHLADDRFARVIEALPTALVLSGRAGQIRVINRQAERMFGYDRSELAGKPVELLLAERFRAQHVDLHQGFLDSMSSHVIGGGQALFGRRKDGTEFPLEIGLNPIDLDGEPMALTVIVDVGPRHRIDSEREAQRRELQRSNADLQEFAYAASHDLKAPLRAIAHLAEWIRDDIHTVASPETIDNLNLLQGRVSRLQMLLDGLLAYARVDRTDAAAEDVCIPDLVHDVTTLMEVPSGFNVVCEGTMSAVRTHRIAIQMVLSNLIGNAVQHHDQATGHVTVSMRAANDLVEFRISDDGPGIPKRFHDRIFLIFQTLKSRDDTESSGIGLALVKKQVEGNGGQIWVESDPPARGTTFVFTWKITSMSQKVIAQ